MNLGNPDVGDDRQRGFDRHTRVFGLDDGSGVTARVVVEGAQQLLPADYATVSAEVWPGPEHRVLGRLTPELLAWAAARCPGATDVRFLEETRIEPGSTLVAIGVVARDASGVRVEGNPLLLLGAEEALCSRTARRAQWLGLGIAASGVALGAIRAGLAALGVP